MPTHISTSGGLISTAFIQNIRELSARQRGIEPKSFALSWTPAPKGPAALEDDIATAWELLKERWDSIRRDLLMMEVSQVRSRWLLPLFQLLDFDPVYLRGDIILDEAGKLRYPLSHRGWRQEDAVRSSENGLHPELVEGPVIHTVAPAQDPDSRMAAGRGIKAKSPHDVVQAFLNASTDDLWAILSNGVLLRLVRDYHHTFTKGYVQFDLESIFETRNYGDFRALYRMCHASRFLPSPPPAGGIEGGLIPLEQFYSDSIATGIKVGEDLRGQVRQAIETLGNGFLDGKLIAELQQDEEQCRAYYAEILRVVYRILFLLFAEQRGMLPRAGAPLEDLYRSHYSITALRARAEGDIPREDDFTDLWEGLKVIFGMVREGAPDLGVFAYDGMLFEAMAGNGESSVLADRSCRNGELLQAIRALTLVEREGALQRISYAALGVEELGSIYESLLDFSPRVSTSAENVNGREIPASTFFLDPRGKERKTTGSYYTHPSLVNELIKSALLPVAHERLATAGLPVIEEDDIGEETAGLLTDYSELGAEQRLAGEEALLSIKVCDPAAGSGHFLVKADNTLGAELARIRTGDEYPSEAQVQAAKRDVLAHCIFAVDLNRMAVELCKLGLWINASERDKPLNFLDHHIKWGNSLIGATPELLERGVPTEAFKAVTGDDKGVAKAIRRRNRQERKQQENGTRQDTIWKVTRVYDPARDSWEALAELAETDPARAREEYQELWKDELHQLDLFAANLWTAAFFWPLVPDAEAEFPTEALFRLAVDEGPGALDEATVTQVRSLRQRYHFFHWHLEFPDVFSDDADGGFDVVLGNPPWERIKLQEKEFFAGKDPEIEEARTAAERCKLIDRLRETNPLLHSAYTTALRHSESLGHFLRDSYRFPLTSGGDINTYAVFAGLGRHVVASKGRVGVVVPLGIATDYSYRGFFADIMSSGQLVSFFDFENRQGIFPGVHRNYNFALTTLTGDQLPNREAEFAFLMTQFDHLQDKDRRFTLTAKDVSLVNPNTHTCPIFSSRLDAEVTTRIYRRLPVLRSETTGINPWGIHFLQMFDMSNDSPLFRTQEALEAKGFTLEGNTFVLDRQTYLPLYESKMMHQFDHRHGTFEGQTQLNLNRGSCRQLTDDERSSPRHLALPRFWIESKYVLERFGKAVSIRGWLIGLRKITRAVDFRTGTFAVLPWAACSYSMNGMTLTRSRAPITALIGSLNSIPCDYVLRQKLGGINLAKFVVWQLTVPQPDRYTPGLLAVITPRVFELTCNAWDIKAFADDVWWQSDEEVRAAIIRQWEENVAETGGHVGAEPPPWVEVAPDGFPHPPFKWNEDRRARLRAELDGLYAHLYGLTREELAYILDTFPIVRRKDETKYREYRTKRMVLEYYERLSYLVS